MRLFNRGPSLGSLSLRHRGSADEAADRDLGVHSGGRVIVKATAIAHPNIALSNVWGSCRKEDAQATIRQHRASLSPCPASPQKPPSSIRSPFPRILFAWGKTCGGRICETGRGDVVAYSREGAYTVRESGHEQQFPNGERARFKRLWVRGTCDGVCGCGRHELEPQSSRSRAAKLGECRTQHLWWFR